MMGVQLADLNNDGKLDLIVTNHQGAKETPEGAVFVYESPKKLTDPWTKHVLAHKFEVLQKGFKQAAPGIPVVFQPHANSRVKPTIVLAGDGSQKVYLLNAVSESPSSWEYEMSILHDCKATAGGIAVGDVMGKNIIIFLSRLELTDYITQGLAHLKSLSHAMIAVSSLSTPTKSMLQALHSNKQLTSTKYEIQGTITS